MQVSLLTTEEACELLRCKSDSLKGLRDSWIQGVHYVRRGKGPTAPILYIKEMILDWLVNQDAPETHQTAIENFRRSLPSGAKRRC
ncbi:hypothetical protein QGP82_23685 [Leptothoe sp. LEGE 181152]|nr:hypothetical protein [Leptothoe sp. LEGE 181152]